MSSIQPKTIKARTGEEVVIRAAQPEDAAAMLAYIRAVAAETDFFILESTWIRYGVQVVKRPGYRNLVYDPGTHFLWGLSKHPCARHGNVKPLACEDRHVPPESPT